MEKFEKIVFTWLFVMVLLMLIGCNILLIAGLIGMIIVRYWTWALITFIFLMALIPFTCLCTIDVIKYFKKDE